MRSRPKWFYAQSAVVPYRLAAGTCEVLLITSRRRKRWTIPKGIIERHLAPADSAAKEAYEEAGARGEVDSAALGVYQYEKWGGTCTVEVFPMRVGELLDAWPEAHVRRRLWLPLHEAVRALRPDALQAIVSRIAERLDADPARES